ncbi:MAG: type II CAAX endopeptidase family protein [Planctomycetota bacterium]|nr:type II CAAX endopeptidase family protein [Planctomycetota bacterium]
MIFQQTLVDQHGATLTKPLPELARSELVYDPGVAELTVSAKLLVKLVAQQELDAGNERLRHGPGGSSPYELWAPAREGDPAADDAANSDAEEPAETNDEHDPHADFKALEASAASRTDRLRVALVAGELLGAPAAVERLETLKAEAEPNGELASDMHWFLTHYQALLNNLESPVPDDVRAVMIARHGWFAELAFSAGLDASDPKRWKVISGGDRLTQFSTHLFTSMLLAGVAGIVAVIIAFRRYVNGKLEWRLVPPNTESPVFLESVALFMVGFTLFTGASLLILGQTDAWAIVLSESLLWSLAITACWPLLRGVSWSDWATDLGLTFGEGLGKEIGAGVLGWLISLPLSFFVGVLIAIAHWVIAGEPESESTDGFPMFEQPMGHTWGVAILSMLGAVLWAPVVEELVFRGAFYQHLRPRVGWGWSIVITSLAFGLLHPYEIRGILQVAFAGVIFALLREWRGSLIAPMVAHALHNLSITAATLGVLTLLE